MQKNQRLETMTERISEDLPEFVELIPPNEVSEGLYRRIRHIQKTGECCGFKMSLEQLKEIVEMASSPTIHDPVRYLCRILDRLHVKRTLQTASNRLKIDERLKNVCHYVRLNSAWQIKLLSDLIHGRYSMDDLMTACEVATKKRQPDRYLIKMFMHGFNRAKMKSWTGRALSSPD